MMEFYEVLKRRRTIRDFDGTPLSDEQLRRIIDAAFMAPSNNHLRELEFVVARGRDEIARLVAPLARNLYDVDKAREESTTGTMEDPSAYAMYAYALPRQASMFLGCGAVVVPFFRQKDCPLLEIAEQQHLNAFAAAWCSVENILLAATAEGFDTTLHIPVDDEIEALKRLVGAPEGYEFTCLIGIGHPAEGATRCRQKEINIEERIHNNKW